MAAHLEIRTWGIVVTCVGDFPLNLIGGNIYIYIHAMFLFVHFKTIKDQINISK